MDLSKVSDETLLALRAGKPLDYSKLPDNDLLALSSAPKANPPMGWGEYIGRGVTDALPVAGMATGGLLGSAVAPVAGSVGGAGLGYAAGSEARGLLNHYVFGDKLPSTKPADQAERVAGNAIEGAAGEMGGQALVKGAGLLAQGAGKINDATSGAAGKYAKKAIKYGLVHYAGVPWPLAPAAVEGMEGLLGKLGKSAPAAESAGAAATEATTVPIETAAKAAKRNIVISPVIKELAAVRKTLPETEGANIDELISKLKDINKYGKVNPEELDTVKQTLQDVLDSEETGPQLRRATVLANDVAQRIRTPGTKIDPFTKKPMVEK